MRLKKHEREQVKIKYGGHCAYCGVLLGEKWHADHLVPVIRLDDDRIAESIENHNIENMMPSCAPCNISKGRQTLEGWRDWIAGHVISLNRHHPIYRLAKAYGLICETGAPVIFYFEKGSS